MLTAQLNLFACENICEILLDDIAYNGELNNLAKYPCVVRTRWIRSECHWMHRETAFVDVRNFACRGVCQTDFLENDAG